MEVLRVGSYPFIQSPWGLLDASGGWQEWTEEFPSLRVTKGSSFFSDDFNYQSEDRILTLWPAPVNGTTMQGLRLASAVPVVPKIRRAPHDY